MRRLVALTFVLSVAAASFASAQNIMVSVNGGTQIASSRASQSFSLTINQEPAPVTNNINIKGAPFFDIGGAYRLSSNLWAGVAFSAVSHKVDSDLSAKVPHPFYFDKPRSVEGIVSDLNAKENVVHVFVGYAQPLTPKLDLMVFGGPSFFNITQDLVTDFDYDSTYPFDTATFKSATTVAVKKSATGFNLGADVGYRLTPTFSVGGLVRFTKASVTLEAAPGNDVDVDAGGVMVGGGVRVRF